MRDVDERIHDVFASAFEDTAREFVHVFATLFPGGEGKLVLTDPEDLLTTGIEVLARPAGKKVSRLSLLSGGERSLTALAYLFAVFRSRPSPFYLMDEVEAALDDVNLKRFLDLVGQFREGGLDVELQLDESLPPLPAGIDVSAYRIAEEALTLLADAGIPAAREDERGWDHGVWIPLRLLYPEADVPVVEVSLPFPRDPGSVLRVGAALAPLRRQNVLLLGSGGIVQHKGGPVGCWIFPMMKRKRSTCLAAVTNANTRKTFLAPR